MTTLDIAQISFLVEVVALGVGLNIYTLVKEKGGKKKKNGDISEKPAK